MTFKLLRSGVASIWTFAKKYKWFLGVLGSITMAIIGIYKFSFWEPPPNVGLELEGGVGAYMRPDFGLPKDLEAFGFDAPSEDIIGMASYELLMGQLFNRGTRDADRVEVRVPIRGAVGFSLADGSKGKVSVRPDQFVTLGDIRVDDKPALIAVFCSNDTPLTEITFRYKEGDATKLVKYSAVPHIDGGRELVPVELWWGIEKATIVAYAYRMLISLGIAVAGVWIVYANRRYLRRRFIGTPVANGNASQVHAPQNPTPKRKRKDKQSKKRKNHKIKKNGGK